MSYQYGGWQQPQYEAGIFGDLAPHPHEDDDYHHNEHCADYLQTVKDEPQQHGHHARSMSAGVIPMLGPNQNFVMPSQPPFLQNHNFFVPDSFGSPLVNSHDRLSPDGFSAAFNANSPIANDDAESIACTSNCNDCPSRCSDAGTACYGDGCTPCVEPGCERDASPCYDSDCLDNDTDDIQDPDCLDNNTANILDNNTANIQEAARVLTSFPHDVDTHMPGMTSAQYLTGFNSLGPIFAPGSMGNMMSDYNNNDVTMNPSFMHYMEQHLQPMLGFGQPCAQEPCNRVPQTCPLPDMRTEVEPCGVPWSSPGAIVEHLQQHNPAMVGYFQQHDLPAFMGYLQQHNWPEGNNIHCGLPSSQTPVSMLSTAPTSPNTPAADVGRGTPMSEATEFSSNAPTNNTEQCICLWVEDEVTCNQHCSDVGSLQNHFRDVHLSSILKTFKPGKDVGGFKCQWATCSRENDFSQKSKLERHLQTHTGFKPVTCDICGANLSAKQSLEQHMRTHTGVKPWVCDVDGCTKAFKQQSALTMHKRTHTGEKPLKCDKCDKCFGESSNLSKHKKTHNVKGSFVCQICGKDFHRQDQLRRHGETHKKNQKTPQENRASRSSSGSNPGTSSPQRIRKMAQSGIKKGAK